MVGKIQNGRQGNPKWSPRTNNVIVIYYLYYDIIILFQEAQNIHDDLF